MSSPHEEYIMDLFVIWWKNFSYFDSTPILLRCIFCVFFYYIQSSVLFPLSGVHKALHSAEPNLGVFEAWFLENRLQPRTLRHPQPALQPAHSACLAFPLCLFSNFTGQTEMERNCTLSCQIISALVIVKLITDKILKVSLVRMSLVTLSLLCHRALGFPHMSRTKR